MRAVARRRHPGELLLRHPATGLGPDGPVPAEGDGAGPGLAHGWREDVLLRAGELHSGPGADRRRGAGAAQLLRRRRAELDRNPYRRWPRPGGGSVDCGRSTGHRRHRYPHRPVAAVPTQPRVPRDPYGRVARAGVRDALPGSRHAHRPRGEAVATARAPGGPARLLPGRQWMGGRRLVRPCGACAHRGPTVVGPAELVLPLGIRAPGRARGRHRHGHVVHVEVPGAGARRRSGAGVGVREPGRWRAWRRSRTPNG